MVKQIFPAITVMLLLSSCSAMKTLSFTNSKPNATASVGSTTSSSAKFLDDITVIPANVAPENKPAPVQTVASRGLSAETSEQPQTISDIIANRTSVETSSPLQLKYAILLETEVEQLQNQALLQGIDEWYGTRYRLGGTTKKGIDCSAFVGAIYTSVFSISLPRTARDQYKASRRISRTELQEGDLLFFNTRGGVSHVGIYLQNNKFIHASTTKGVTISDMFDPYYLRRFIGAGRIDKTTIVKNNP